MRLRDARNQVPAHRTLEVLNAVIRLAIMSRAARRRQARRHVG
jgi:hypothetical protein